LFRKLAVDSRLLNMKRMELEAPGWHECPLGLEEEDDDNDPENQGD
jgi:hypothetical protein